MLLDGAVLAAVVVVLDCGFVGVSDDVVRGGGV